MLRRSVRKLLRHSVAVQNRRFPQASRLATDVSVGGCDTIYALSSGAGRCGVAVFRVSGRAAAAALDQLTRGKRNVARHASLRTLYHPATKEPLDKALTLWFPRPSSFTGEDCAEFHIHGGPAVIAALADALSHVDGLRPAEAGEFTRRAFAAGKLDLAQVEGLGDLIHAETEEQRKQALRQMDGHLSKVQESWRKQMIKLSAMLEAHIDFSETDDLDQDDTMTAVAAAARLLAKELEIHLSDARAGQRLRGGVRVAVVGEPNAGKSSFLNLLCQREAAIVSPIAGTTRDAVEATLDLGGYPVLVVDTAGLRANVNDPVEAEGVARAVKNADAADLVLYVLDASSVADAGGGELPPHAELRRAATQRCLDFGLADPSHRLMLAVNKMDLLNHVNDEFDDGVDVVYLSCVAEGGAKEAVAALASRVALLCGRRPAGEPPALTRSRHVSHARRALAHLHQLLADLDKGDGSGRVNAVVDEAVLAEYLRGAAREIGAIAGRVGPDDVLDSIFADFCIGK